MPYSLQHCTMPNANDAPITPMVAERMMEPLPSWKICEGGKAMARSYSFKNYAEALALINQISAIAEAENHHPDISFGWGYATITFTTHAIGGLHMNDFIMASKLNQMS